MRQRVSLPQLIVGHLEIINGFMEKECEFKLLKV